MPVPSYGVLKGKAKDERSGQGKSPHFQVKVSDHDRFRIAINVKSQLKPSDLFYYVDENFDHPILLDIEPLEFGFHSLENSPGGAALDFIRGNFFDTTKMVPLPYNVPGADNDLNELLHKYVDRAIAMESAVVYAFGSRWGPEENKRDAYFDFLPGNGIHDIHMNQGNDKGHLGDDGIWQDGGLLFHLPDENRWVAVFLAFQSQCFHTDDVNGHKIPGACGASAVAVVEKRVAIVAALVSPAGPDMGLESVTILNTTPNPIDLAGWTIADRKKRKAPISGILEAGDTARVKIPGTGIEMPSDGGIITLLDNKGLKVDGVSYTKKDASREGWTIVF
jgi:uncharacterized protein YukJ